MKAEALLIRATLTVETVIAHGEADGMILLVAP